MCGCFCIGFVDFMLNDQSLLDYTNLVSPEKYGTCFLKFDS